jgi:ATP-dependent protease Clp ATPase subunit
MSSESTALSCTFCHKSEKEVVALLAFPDRLHICDECIWLMVEIVERWSRLSEQIFRLDKWSLCQG